MVRTAPAVRDLRVAMGALSSHPITVYSGKANRAEQCEKGLLETGPHLSDDVLGVGKVAA